VGVATTYAVTGLTSGTSYSFVVRAKDAAGNISVASAVVSVTTLDKTAPTAPTALTASNILSTGVSLKWTAATDNVAVIGYNIYNNGTGLLLGSTTGAALTFAVTGLTPLTAYSFNVKARMLLEIYQLQVM